MTHLKTIGVAKRSEHLVHSALKYRHAGFGAHGHDTPLVRTVKHRHRERQKWAVVRMHFDLSIPMAGVGLGEPQRSLHPSEQGVVL